MRLSIVTFGSEGDTRPLAALCRGLLDQGHELKLFAEQSTLSLPRRFGVPCEALPGDVQSTLPIADPKQEIRLADVINTTKAMKAILATHTAAWLRIVAEHARESDAILFSSLAYGVGAALREELNKPAIGLWFQPITPTRAFCSPMIPPMKLPGWANLLTYRLLHRQIWSFCGESTQAARREVFGTTSVQRPRFDHPMLYGISRELVPRPDDWPDTHRICGHWCMPIDDWQPTAELVAFLSSGEPPIYVGFGSPSSFIRAKALNALVDAIAGRRAIFAPGWSRIDASVLPKNFFIARDVPHEWLFRSVSMAIHHGGAGTTHTAARAGIPQVILPLGADHPFWASRVAARGAAPKYTRGARVNAKAIAAMIELAARAEMREDARGLGEAMGREDGVGYTVREIERLLARGTPLAEDRLQSHPPVAVSS